MSRESRGWPVLVAVLAMFAALAGCSRQPGAAEPTDTSAATETSAVTETSAATGPETAPATSPPLSGAPMPAPAAYAVTISAMTTEQLPFTYHEGCPVPVEDLRLMTITHHGFDGTLHTGELVVHADQADRVGRIFERLYDAGFPIERMRSVDAYGGSTEAALADNNTSGFHCRPVTGGTRWSEHAYGRAIDINPVQNPYVRGDVVLPESGRGFLDRGTVVPGLIADGDAVVAAFAAEGWTWGGTWSTLRDYQHFSLNGR